MAFKEANIREIGGNFVKMISEDWALLTAGGEEGFNTMTVSWGALGELWGKDVAIIFVRPQRYTFEFMEKSDFFTLSFFGEGEREALKLCGSRSGRDCDKVALSGLTPYAAGDGVIFEEAQTAVVCRKMALQQLDPAGFLSSEIEKNYKDGDYHRVYIGEILKTYKKV